MQTVHVAGRAGGASLAIDGAHGLPGLGNYVESVGCRIDDGRGGNADLRIDVVIRGDVGRSESGDAAREETRFPKLNAGRRIGVKGVDAIVFGGDENDVARRAGEIQVGHPQRLRVDVAIDGAGEKLPETCRVHRGRRQAVFLQVLAGARIVVVMRVDAGEIGNGNQSGTADRSVGIADSGHGVRAGLRTGRIKAGGRNGSRGRGAAVVAIVLRADAERLPDVVILC